MADTVVDTATGEVVEGTALEVIPHRNTTLFATDDPVEVIAKASSIAEALADVLERKHLYQNIQGKSHILVEGWTLLGSMLGVSAVVTSTLELENGWKAHVEARTIDGRVVGAADAICTRDENRWKSASDYAILGMAQTRATSRALRGPLGFIVNLAGYSPTAAEEMPEQSNGDAPKAQPPDAKAKAEPEPRKHISKVRANNLLLEAIDSGANSNTIYMCVCGILGDEIEPWNTRTEAVAVLSTFTPDQAKAFEEFFKTPPKPDPPKQAGVIS